MDQKRFKWIISGLDWDQLSDRELSFVESCEERMEKKGNLTEPMEKWLEDIFARKTR